MLVAKIASVLCLLSAVYRRPAVAQIYTQPEQVHLAIGENVDDMVVTWVTMNPAESLVEYGFGTFTNTVNGTQSTFQDGGDEKRNIYMHRATLSKLQPKTRYVYHVGGMSGWSDKFTFKTFPNTSDWSPRFAMYGDMGNKNASSLPRLQMETQQNHFDLIIHAGDFAYNMETNNARYGDEFMRQIEPIAGYVPYMTSPGNHEEAYNFSNYKARFSMPGGDRENQFYSYNVGPIHFISFSSEFYYYLEYGSQQVANQFQWLEKDLQTANLPLNRLQRPWIIAMGHRPMYCSNTDHNHACTNDQDPIRVGFPQNTVSYGLEQLFYKYGVDIIFAGHEHTYERMWPVYNWTVCNSSDPYTNPTSPIYIVTGSAGSQEGHPGFITGGQPWSAFRNSDFGYSRVQVFNATHLYLDQLSDDTGKVVDHMWLKKSKHGAGLYTCHQHQDPYIYLNKQFVLASSVSRK